MRFFRKKIRTKIEDRLFLRIDWNEDFNLKTDALKNLVERIDQEHASRSNKSVIKDFLYITIQNAEELFALIRDDLLSNEDDYIVIDKVQLVYQDEETPASIENQAFVNKLVINKDYRNLLKPLVATVFNEPVFDQEPYEQTYESKIEYFQENIFPFYEDELEIDSTDIPILPSLEDVTAAKVNNTKLKIKYPDENHYLNGVSNQTEEPNSDINQSDSQPIVEEDHGQNVMLNDSLEMQEPPVLPEKKVQTTTQQVSNSTVNDEETGSLLDDLASSWESNSQNKHLTNLDNVNSFEGNVDVKLNDIPVSTTELSFTFPRFEIVTFEKSSYEPYETEYPAWKLNEQKKQWNDFLEQQEKINLRWAKKSVSQAIEAFENTEKEALGHKIAKSDHRDNLKQEVLVEVKKRQAKDLKSRLANLKQEHESNLEELKEEYEQKVRIAKADYEEAKQIRTKEIESEYYKIAHDEYQEKYFALTAGLQKIADEGLAMIAKEKSVRLDFLNQEKTETAEKVGQQLFESCQSRLGDLEKSYLQEHQVARTEHNLARKEALNIDLVAKAKEHSEQMKNEVQKLKQDNQRLQAEKQAAAERLIDQKQETVNHTANMLKEFQAQATQQKVLETKEPVEEKSVGKQQSSTSGSSLGKVALGVFLGIGVSAGSFGVYSYNQHLAQQNAAIQRISDRLESQESQNKVLLSQRDKAIKEKEKASSQAKANSKKLDSTKANSSSNSNFDNTNQATSSANTTSSK